MCTILICLTFRNVVFYVMTSQGYSQFFFFLIQENISAIQDWVFFHYINVAQNSIFGSVPRQSRLQSHLVLHICV